ncbi:hypothetical protein [Rhodopseudomonas sp. B29]|uniref:hypothetical protein n=1 Tax=Rhodopseudomonas sp. B29 TaxID=95607 RepID=UPI0003498ABD|nr:hypothetical protein [Rhodopseudomonas sp. B29]
MTSFAAKPPKRGFDHVETWVFDLDNTLYPHHVNLWHRSTSASAISSPTICR